MTEVYVFKIMGDWQMVPTSGYELDFVKSENEVVLRPSNSFEKETREYRVKWTELKVFPTAAEALAFIRAALSETDA